MAMLVIGAIVLIAIVLFVTERWPPDIVALGILVALVVTGLVTPRDALMVISYLTTVPEPGTLVLAAAGLPVLVGYVWRRRRKRAGV